MAGDFSIEGEWTETSGRPFLIHDSGTVNKRVVVFATDEALRHPSTQNRWFVDGTFSVEPPLFKQVFAIRTKLGETAVTCCYALLSGEAQELYEEVIEAVLNRCETLGFPQTRITST